MGWDNPAPGWRRAEQRERDLVARYPDAWVHMDELRTDPPTQWPDWCLLPMAAAAAVVEAGSQPRHPWDIAALSAVYAWRYSRSIYLIEPALMTRLINQIPDTIELQDLTALPEWCILVAEQDALLWMHLEHDVNTGLPELRLLLDLPDHEPLPIPVYLDRPTLTEAIADMRATALATLAGPGEVVPGQDVQRGPLDAAAALLAERVERDAALAAYLARPEAAITERGRPGVRPPVRSRRPAPKRRVWLVGQPPG